MKLDKNTIPQASTYDVLNNFEKMIEVMTESRDILKAKREISLVITKLEEAEMWYNQALIIQGKNVTPPNKQTQEGEI